MSLSRRLTRAGLVLLMFGAICAVLPSNPTTYASTNLCNSPELDAISTSAVIVGVGGYQFFFIAAGRRRHHHNDNTNGTGGTGGSNGGTTSGGTGNGQ